MGEGFTVTAVDLRQTIKVCDDLHIRAYYAGHVISQLLLVLEKCACLFIHLKLGLLFDLSFEVDVLEFTPNSPISVAEIQCGIINVRYFNYLV